VRQVLGHWRAPAEGPTLADIPSAPPEPLLPPTLLVHLPAAVQSSVVVCAPFVGLDAPDLLAGQLAAAVVGGGYSARLGQELRIRRGLTYSATARIEQQRAGGLLVAETQTEHRHAAEVAGLMRTQILGLARQTPGEAELAARRSALLGTLARQLDTTSGRVAQIGEVWSQGLPVDSLTRLPARMARVEAEPVRAFAQMHWPAEALRTVVVGRIDPAAWRDFDAAALRLDAAALALDSPLLRR
jgi:zinc protease